MAYQQRDNSGSLFKNDRKEQDNHPDYTGTGMYGGSEFYISAWLKETKGGKKYYSFSFKPKHGDTKKADRAPPRDEFDDDAGF